MLIKVLFVGVGGFCGAVARYLLGLLPVHTQSGFPIITLLINVMGAFLIGVIAVSTGKQEWLSPNMVLFLKVGLCGGFTTFSTFSLELFQLLEAGKCFTGILYGICSVIFCLIAVCIAHIVFS